jgi:hypothetical protein
MSEINHFNVCTMQYYLTDDVLLIWQLVNDVAVDNIDILHVRE